MIASFGDQATRDIFNGLNSKAARTVPQSLHGNARRKLDILNQSTTLGQIAAVPGLELERLKGRLSAFYSIRVNRQYRILFAWKDLTGEAFQVQISKHYE